jgi:hypothetical protein
MKIVVKWKTVLFKFSYRPGPQRGHPQHGGPQYPHHQMPPRQRGPPPQQMPPQMHQRHNAPPHQPGVHQSIRGISRQLARNSKYSRAGVPDRQIRT